MWPELTYELCICLDGLETCLGSWSLGRDLNLGPPKYKTRALTTQP
jgi:hypothetical protein